MFQSSRLLTEVPELIPSFRLTSKDLVYTTRVSRPSLMQIRLSVHLRLVVHGQRNDAQGSCGTRKRNILFRLVTIHMVLLHTYALYMNGGVVEYHLPTYSQLNTELVRGPMSGMAFNRPHRSCLSHNCHRGRLNKEDHRTLVATFSVEVMPTILGHCHS